MRSRPVATATPPRHDAFAILANKRWGGSSFMQTSTFSTEQGTASAQLHATDGTALYGATMTDFGGQQHDVAIAQSTSTQDGVDSVVGDERLRTTFALSQRGAARLDMFGKGRQTELAIHKPAWVELLDEVQGLGASGGAVTAPTPSRVVAVMCSVDQEVKQGQTLVILEGAFPCLGT
jgi:biotin carboxyl carrier protein